MPRDLTANPEFTDTITVPRDGEGIDAGDVNAPMTDLLGNDLYLRAQLADLTRTVEEMRKAAGGFVLVAPAGLTLEPGQTYAFPAAIALGRQAGYASDVTLAMLDLPAGVTATFTPAVLSGATVTSTLTLNVSAGAVAGPYNLRVQGTGADGKISQALIATQVTAQTQQPTFTISPGSTSGSIDRGAGETSEAFVFGVTRAGMFGADIQFSVVNPPAGITATFAPATVSGAAAVQPAATTLTLTAAGSLPAGTYTIQVRAVSGSIVRTQALSLTVTAAQQAGDDDYTLTVVYDAGDYRTTNGATLYINRQNGYTGPVELRVIGGVSPTEPLILVNGKIGGDTVYGNTARLIADGAGRGWTNAGVADLPDNYPLTATFGMVRGSAEIEGKTVTRYASLEWRWGNRSY
ncbi:COG1470 family protein [Deinococcus radiotolerans]|uniref:Uncharacterized protein n=1 Tax=Deinococcus radiotolerans TaxID=1309407 RepID=A0ABQ2FQ90_9DEIO|nr:hypothetical protein [Deinococcus radiotolerans]GGL15977.1 hypothetical protein GCM10010844_38600 [Deinococcus radiotolerans]